MTTKTENKRSALCSLVKKEIFFTTHPTLWLFSLLGVLILIPDYPMIVAPGYVFLAIFTAFNIRRANKDLDFTVTLPVRRRDVVTGSAVLVVAFELLTLAVCGICAALADFVISPAGNAVGLDPNLAFFGVVLIGYGVFNRVFLPGFYRTGYKAGFPTLFGVVGYLVLYAACETLVRLVPALTVSLDGLNPEYVPIRAIAFVFGAILFAALTFDGVKAGQKKFDKISL